MRQDVVQHHGVPIRLKCCDHVRICPDPFGNWPTIAGSWRSFLEGNSDKMPRWHSRGHTGSRRSSVVGYTYGTYVPATCSSNKAVDLIHRPETQHLQPREKRLVDGSVSNVDVVPVPGRCQQQVPGTTNLFSINMDNGHVNNGFGLMESHCVYGLVYPIEDWNIFFNNQETVITGYIYWFIISSSQVTIVIIPFIGRGKQSGSLLKITVTLKRVTDVPVTRQHVEQQEPVEEGDR
nr:unnamed protein product [Callosobruchus analis]